MNFKRGDKVTMDPSVLRTGNWKYPIGIFLRIKSWKGEEVYVVKCNGYEYYRRKIHHLNPIIHLKRRHKL